MIRQAMASSRRAGLLILALQAHLACAHAPPAAPPAAPSAAGAPGALRSEWLQDPDRAVEFMRRSADLWLRAYDPEHGGFYTDVARDGTTEGSDLKAPLSQSRNAYAFARAYMVTGDPKYLVAARRAVAFLREKGWDREHGGFHTGLNRRGERVDLTQHDPNANQKWSFLQHYALLGVAALYDVARAPDDLAFLLRGRQVIDEKLWDARPGLEGYFETAEFDWTNPRGKGFTPTVDGITTHGLSLYLLTRDDAHRARLLALADAIVERILPTVSTRKLGFAEGFDSDWRERPEGFFFVGHVLKTAWCLNRAYMIDPRPAYRAGAEDLLRRVAKTAWDDQYGGPYYAGDSLLGVITQREKNWWTVEQAITAGLTGWHLTGDPLYLRMADESADFFVRHLVDPTYGDAYDSTDPTGAIVPSRTKGHFWKAGYHTSETGWFVYLYGNLFLKHEPVTLHYAIDATLATRTLPLDPIAIEPGALVIQEVLLDGEPYDAYDAKARTLTVPAGVGGAFRVTFAPVAAPTAPAPPSPAG